MNLDPDIITEAWRSLRIRTPFDDECTDVNPKSVKELFSTLKELNQLTKLDDPNSVLECSNFSDMNKQHMLRLWQAKADENLKWGIDVVVANSNIRKSLHPKIWLIVDGQEIEMSLEVFAKLRFEISRALYRIDCYT
ncbi:F-box protein [Dirofilaria immitis]